MVSRLLRPLLLACLLGALAACTRGAPVDQTELRAAVGNEPVVLLSATWCGYCRKLRADLKRWGVHFAEYDVEQSEAGARAFALLHGRGVPILLVGDTRSHGYVPNQVRKTLLAAGLLPANAPD